MKKLLGGIAISALLAAPAVAADLPARVPVKAAPAPIVAVYNWTGLYIGAAGGFGWSNTKYTFPLDAVSFNIKGNGGLAGGQVGYNWQVNNFVLGLEVEGAWANIKKDNVACTIVQAALCSTEVRALGSVRGRAGVAIDRALLYVAGGWAVARMDYDRVFQPAGVPFLSGVTDTVNGWVVAGGLEYGFTPNWVGRVQYDHYHFGTNTYAINTLSNTQATEVRTNVNTIRVGLSYKFGGPVVARY